MSRVNQWLDRYNSIFSKFRVFTYIDFGSNNIRLVVDNKLVFHQSSCLAIDRNTGAVLAIGDKALSFLGKTPPHIEVIFPVNKGRVTDKNILEKYLLVLNKDYLSKKKNITLRVEGFFGLSVGLSLVDKKIFSKILYNVGWSGVKPKLISDNLVNRFVRAKNTETNLAILDIGGRKSELSLFAAGGKIFSKKIYIGGDDFTQKIRVIVRKKYQLSIGWITAEKIKKNIGYVYNIDNRKMKSEQFVIRGKDLIENIVKSTRVSAADFKDELAQLVDDFVEQLKEVLLDVSSEAVSESMGHAIYLVGGGSQLKGLSQNLQNQFKTEVVISKTPELDGVLSLLP